MLINLLKYYNIKLGNPLKVAPKVFDYNTLCKNFKLSGIKKFGFKIPYNFYKKKLFTSLFWKSCYEYIILDVPINDLKLIKLIKKNFNERDYLELITIYSILISIGKFSIANKIRNYFFYVLKKKKFFFINKYIKKILSVDQIFQPEKKSISYLSKMKTIKDLVKYKKNFFNEKYYDYIKNKKISVVGVSDGLKGNANNIDKADIVVKFNYFSNKYYSNKSTQSKRCDISYFSDYFLINKKNLLLQSKNNLKYLVFKLNKKNNYNLLPKNKIIKTNIFDRLILGTPSILINSVIDLISYSPHEIKIFNSTLSYPINNKIRNINTKKYRKLVLEKKFSIFSNAKSFGIHDIISEYIVLKNLFNLKIIKVDNQLKKILDMGLDSYLEGMEKNYKNSILLLLNKNYKNL